jgi:hypothetical protein
MCIAIALVFALGSSVWAQASGGPGAVRQDNYYGTWEGDNVFVGGGGTGWRDPSGAGPWFGYDLAPPQQPLAVLPVWWNEWFYNDPPSIDRWKWIDWSVKPVWDPIPGAVVHGNVMVALNWSTMGWESGPGGAPPMSTDEAYIGREVVVSTPIEDSLGWNGHFVIPDFNPEWVSIDVRVIAWQTVEHPGGNMDYPLQVTLSGNVIHQCVPEPGTLVLLLTAGIGLVLLAWRRRK